MKVSCTYNIYLSSVYKRILYENCFCTVIAIVWCDSGGKRDVKHFCDSGADEKVDDQDIYSPYCIVMQLIAVK